MVEAEGVLATREQEVANTEVELDTLERRLADERAAVVDQDARVQALYATIEAVELQIPPESRQRGAAGAQAATPQLLTQQLMQVQATLHQLQPGDFSAEAKAAITWSLQTLDAQGVAADQARRERRAQEAERQA